MEATTRTADAAARNGTAAKAAASQSPVAKRLQELRSVAVSEPAVAQREAWEWFQDAGRRIASEREAAIGELDELFRAGAPSEGLEGQTEGILVGFTMQRHADRAIAALTSGWMPWAGKRFDSANAKGDNLLARSARWPARVLWPRYSVRDAGENLTAFDFTTRVEEGAVDPGLDVLVIDYAPVASNPRVIIKSIRDELVEVVPGTHLGKMLWRTGPYKSARYHPLAFFALKTPVS